jgi:pilus assembly protein CpaE
MRAVVAHPPGANVRDVRQALLGAGFSCLAEDCVEWDELPPRVARGDADLLVMQTDSNAHANWDALREARQLTSAPAIAVGPQEPNAMNTAQQSGVEQYIDAKSLPDGLDSALATMQTGGAIRPQRGTLCAVISAMPGCGGTTVALNLAGAMARQYPNEATLIELAREGSAVADWLELEVEHPAHEVFGRHAHLDASSLKAAFSPHALGLKLVMNCPDLGCNPKLDSASVKRLAVLSRVASRFTVFAVDEPASEPGVAALRAADVVLMVVRGDVPSVKRARRLLVALPGMGVSTSRVRIVLNRDGQAGQLSTAQIESGLGQAIQHRIPDDPARVNRAMNYGELVVGSWGARISRSFRALAKDLAGVPSENSWWHFA